MGADALKDLPVVAAGTAAVSNPIWMQWIGQQAWLEWIPFLWQMLIAVLGAAVLVLTVYNRVLEATQRRRDLQENPAPCGSFWRFIRGEGGAVGARTAIGGAAAASVIALATPFIAKWEGVKLEAYRDLVGVETICFGHTKGVQMGDRATMRECVEMLNEEVVEYYAAIAPCMENPDIPVGVQAAMLELAYNVGPRAVCRSTMMQRANAGQYSEACGELHRWVRAGGRRVRGLENRRADSKHALCLAGAPA